MFSRQIVSLVHDMDAANRPVSVSPLAGEAEA